MPSEGTVMLGMVAVLIGRWLGLVSFIVCLCSIAPEGCGLSEAGLGVVLGMSPTDGACGGTDTN